MKVKVIPERIVAGSCHNCPYCRYDSYYSMSTDSGYDCEHEDGGRIADDSQIEIYRRKKNADLPILSLRQSSLKA